MLLPYTVDVPMERRPWANWLLIAVTLSAGVASWVSSEPVQGFRDAVRLMRQDDPKVLHKEARELQRRLREPLSPRFSLQHGPLQPAELFSHIFVHADLWLLIGNMVFLFCFGNAVNAKLGHLPFLLVYLLFGAASGLVWLAVGKGDFLVGASGAVMGVTGLFFVFFPRNEVRCVYGIGNWWSGAGTFEISSFWLVLLFMSLDLVGNLLGGSGGAGYACDLGGGFVGCAVGIGLLLSGLVKSEYYEENLLQMIGVQPRTLRKQKSEVRGHKPAAKFLSFPGSARERAAREALPRDGHEP
jgi:membrane associated rhomboid family serine protease